jgi:hypothetical protein
MCLMSRRRVFIRLAVFFDTEKIPLFVRQKHIKVKREKVIGTYEKVRDKAGQEKQEIAFALIAQFFKRLAFFI